MTFESTPPRHLRRRRRRRRATFAAVAIVLAALVTLTSLALTRLEGNLTSNSIARPGTSIDSEPVAPNWDGPIDILILGSDQRAGQLVSTADSESVSGARSDTILIFHLAADHHHASVVSIPRDLIVRIPECISASGERIAPDETGQVNAALNAGPYCALDTLRDLTGLPLDHFAIIDFDAALSISEAIGGVDVCVAHAVHDEYSGLELDAGTHTLTGRQALAFLRTRHAFADASDLGRIRAQQAFLASVFRKLKSDGVLANPVAALRLADLASKSVSLDPALADPFVLAGLAAAVGNIDLHHLALIQLPVEPYWADENRLQLNAVQAQALFDALASDLPVPLPTMDSSEPSDSAEHDSSEAPGPETTGDQQDGILAPSGQLADVSPCVE